MVRYKISKITAIYKPINTFYKATLKDYNSSMGTVIYWSGLKLSLKMVQTLILCNEDQKPCTA